MSPARHARRRPRRTWLQRLVIATGITLTVLCLTAATGLAYGVWRFGQIDRTDIALPEAASGAPRNYLIVGSDSREGFSEDDPDAAGIVGPDTEGRRSDTIVIARVDPGSEQVAVLSLPRDLWVPIAGRGYSSKINAAYGEGEQVLADTIQQSFGIDIHHYLEVDFRGFKGLVEAMGGVPLYFDRAMSDPQTGLDIDGAGCVTLDGDQALAFARARALHFETDEGRVLVDGTADLGRITRQQIFMRQALSRAVSRGLTDPITLNRLVGVALDNVTVDGGLDAGSLLSLGRRFAGFDADQLVTHTLPVEDFQVQGQDALRVLPIQAQPTLNIFRGLPPDALSPSVVDLRVLNGTAVDGQAASVATALEAVGFSLDDEPGNAGELGPATVPRTQVHYGSGGAAAADLVARHLTGGADPYTNENLGPGEVVLITGTDFDAVSTEARPATVAPETTTTGPPDGTGAATSDETTTTTTEPVGVAPEAPPGVECG